MNQNKKRPITHGIVHAGFRGMRAFVARKKSRCKLIGNRLVIPHDTIPSTVMGKAKRPIFIHFKPIIDTKRKRKKVLPENCK